MPPHSGLDHKPPDGIEPQACYFITVCAEPRGTNHFCHPSLGSKIIESIRHYHEQRSWFCHVALLMPDHIHLLLNIASNDMLSQTIGSWKRWLAKYQATSWQPNYFDHRLRNDESLQQKTDYILLNPVRAGLIQQAQDWPYVWLATK